MKARVPKDELDAAALAVAQKDPGGETLLLALCARFPEDARAHFLLGAMLDRLGRGESALQAFSRALELDAGHVQALSAKAAVLVHLGRLPEARGLLEAAVQRLPAVAQLWFNLGAVLESLAEWEGALGAYDRALGLPGAPPGAFMNRGYVLTRLGRLEEALENNQRLAALHPANPDFQFNVAEILLALHRYQDAVAACDRALEAQPDHAKALIDRGVALAALGRVDAAQHDLDDVRKASPETLDAFNLGFAERTGGLLQAFGAYSIYFHLGYEALERGDWTHREALARSVEDRLRDETGSRRIVDPNIPFRTLGLDLDASVQQAIATTVAQAIEVRAARFPSLPMPGARAKARIRLGYVSPDFRVHPTSFLTRPLYRGHDRSRFEVFGYALTRDDGSWIRRELQGGFDAFRDMSSADAGSLAQQMRNDGIDIAIDLAGYTRFARSEAFALRPAPLQVSWLAYPSTLGARYMDYAILDSVVCPPGADRYWAECIVRLPHAYLIADRSPRHDASGVSRPAMGLPDGAFVFCCFNNAWKIEPVIFSVWMDLLRRVPGSVLWLLALRPEVEPNLKREAAARGIDPDRLVFGGHLPNERHLARYALADLFLDTLYCNAHTTAVDALREATPVVTVPGKTVASRVAASLLRAAGTPELICKDLAEYRDTAVRLTKDHTELARMREKLREGRGRAPLFDAPRFIRNLEKAFETMWLMSLDGAPAHAFTVDEMPLPPPVANRWH